MSKQTVRGSTAALKKRIVEMQHELATREGSNVRALTELIPSIEIGKPNEDGLVRAKVTQPIKEPSRLGTFVEQVATLMTDLGTYSIQTLSGEAGTTVQVVFPLPTCLAGLKLLDDGDVLNAKDVAALCDAELHDAEKP